MPVIKQETFPNGISLILWLPQEDELQLKQLLHGNQSRYDHLLAINPTSKRRIELLAARVALDTLLNKSTLIDYALDGKKPYLKGGGYISISHTEGCVAVAYHPHMPVGLDVERISERILRLRSKFMNEIELEQTRNEDGVIKSLLIWSAKESAFKLLGQQEVDFANHLKVQPFSLSDSGQFQLHEFKTREKKIMNVNYQVFPHWVLTIIG